MRSSAAPPGSADRSPRPPRRPPRGAGRRTLLLLAAAAALAAGFAGGRRAPPRLELFLPGTQVGTVEAVDDPALCKNCHHSTAPDRPVALWSDWSGSMMSHAARDPLFYAALAAANKVRAASGEFCIRCHSPGGWLAGHSEDATGASLAGIDLDGITCDYCHRAADPLNPDTSLAIVGVIPGFGNGMHAVQRYRYPKRGPFDSLIAPHAVRVDPFQRRGEMCGTCHDVSNPFSAADRTTQPPYAYAPLERTYSEWALSAFAREGESGTCQGCHMRDTSGYSSVYPSSWHGAMARHDLTGGNTFIPAILADFWPGLDSAAVAEGALRAAATLGRGAALSISAAAAPRARADSTTTIRVRVTNLTGHKLPTGYPEGRRMWLGIAALGAGGDTLYRSGVYDSSNGTLVPGAGLKVYEALLGLSAATASAAGLPPGPSFHFALADSIISDNRIPPRGFRNDSFAVRNASPVGVSYADGQYWDETDYAVPAAAAEVRATLFYQSVSGEYIRFLRDVNAGNSFDWNGWGEKLHAAWDAHGRSTPVAMASATLRLASEASPPDRSLPRETTLFPSYPNPFNPATEITYTIPSAAHVTLRIVNMAGQLISEVVNTRKPAGIYRIRFDGSMLPSGVYFVLLDASGRRFTQKILLLR